MGITYLIFIMSNYREKPLTVLKNEWGFLSTAVKDAAHEYHLFTLSTINGSNPEIRTVVLRDVDINNYQISFHTDIRSPKYKQMKKNPNIGALFYDSLSKIQLRLKGTPSFDQDPSLLKQLWSKMNKDSKQCYQGKYPPSETLLDGVEINNIDTNYSYEYDIEHGFENFSRITVNISSMEILMLHHLGHKRIKYNLLSSPVEYWWVAS